MLIGLNPLPIPSIPIDLELSQSRRSQEQLEVSTAQRECSKLERANRKLKEEMRALQDQMADEMVPRAQMEAYKKEVDIKVG